MAEGGTYLVADVLDALKRWNFVRAGEGRDHQEWKHPLGKVVSLKKGRSAPVNAYQIAEICNILGVKPPEFFRGPAAVVGSHKAPPPPLPVVPPEPAASDQPSTNGKQASGVAPTTADPGPGTMRMEPRRKIVAYLHSMGGSVKDTSGRATSKIVEATGHQPQAATSLLRAMEHDGQIVRDINGKRCYEIVLCYDGPSVRWMVDQLPGAPAQPEAIKDLAFEPPPEPDLQIEPEPPAPELKLTQHDYEKIGEAVVQQLVRRLTMSDRTIVLESRVDELQRRLHRLTEYDQRLRRENNELRDQR